MTKQKITIKNEKNKNITFIIFMLIIPVAHLLFFSVYLNIKTITMAFESIDIFGKTSFTIAGNFKLIFDGIIKQGSYNLYVKSFIYSFLYLPVSVVIILPISLVCSYFLYKKIFASTYFRVIFFMPSIISIVALTIAYRYMFNSNFGIINKILNLFGLSKIIPSVGWFGSSTSSAFLVYLFNLWSGLGYNIVLIQGAMARIPTEIIESGEIDGVGIFKELTTIITPLVFSTISTLAILGCTSVFTTYIQPMLLTGVNNPNGIQTLASLIFYQTKYGTLQDQHLACALGILVTLIAIPVILSIRFGLDKLTPDTEY